MRAREDVFQVPVAACAGKPVLLRDRVGRRSRAAAPGRACPNGLSLDLAGALLDQSVQVDGSSAPQRASVRIVRR
jgi:hypothetical protein